VKQLFDDRVYRETVNRIGSLHPDSKAKWGKMNVAQMLCHCTDPLRELLGLRPTKDMSTFLSRTLFKWISLRLMRRWPEGRLPTSREYDQMAEGTAPAGFEKDRAELLRLLSEIHRQPGWYRFHRHPFFGRLSRLETGRLVYLHFDHHLRQFGV
jgi:hypothetical protein